MRRVSKADLKENSERYKGCTFLEPREWLDGAIVGRCVSTGGIIYDYDSVIEAYMTKDNITYDQAAQAVDYTIDRVIPKMPHPIPLIEREPLETEFDEEPSDDEDLD